MVPTTARPPGISRSRRYLPELESLRGIAILLVFAFHADRFVNPYRDLEREASPWFAFVAAGHTGVDLFFLLSGFLLALPFLDEAAGGRPVGLRTYYARRALRILPLYWCAVLVGTVLTATRPMDLLGAVPYLLFVNSFAGIHGAPQPYGMVWWSLATEVQFYLLLPVLRVVRSWAGRLVGAGLLVAYAVAYVMFVRGDFHMQTLLGQLALLRSVFARGPLFLWGMAAAALYRRHGRSIAHRLAAVPWVRNGGADLVLVGVLAALGFFLRWLVAIGTERQVGAADQTWHVVNGGLWAAIVLLVLLAPLRLKPVLSNPVLGELGILSYSLYMIHAPFMVLGLTVASHLVPGMGGGWNRPTAAVVVVLALGCVGLSAVTYRVIEKPFLARKARFDA